MTNQQTKIMATRINYPIHMSPMSVEKAEMRSNPASLQPMHEARGYLRTPEGKAGECGETKTGH